MNSKPDPPKTLTTRHKCSACFKQYKKKEHLVEHMRGSYHSVHQPKCRVCQKHCKTFESLREHLTGPLSKGNCSKIFTDRGCSLCLNLFENSVSLSEHFRSCKLPAPSPLKIMIPISEGDPLPDHSVDTEKLVTDFDMLQMPCTKAESDTLSPMEGAYRHGSEKNDGEVNRLIDEMSCTGSQIEDLHVNNKDHQIDSEAVIDNEMVSDGRDTSENLGARVTGYTGYSGDICSSDNNSCKNVPEAVAIDCEMVGGGSDGSLDICARVCLIDEDENLLFHAYVEPQIPVTNYRYDITGITEDHLENAMPLKEVQEKILQILYNGESIVKARLSGGKARLLVGHDVEHDLDCLKLSYPDHLLRDTARYRPLMKTNLVSHSLKYLTLSYLGYEIQSGVHDPFIDCVCTMRLYKRMRDQDHHDKILAVTIAPQQKPKWMTNSFDARKNTELETMSPDELFQISCSNYRCWCLDRTDPSSIVSLEEREASVETPWPAWPVKREASVETPWPAWPTAGPFSILSI